MDINSLERFIKAQTNTYKIAMSEIKNGKKRTHWMWFVFPQLRGLGMSSISRYYGIEGIEEARAYLEHLIDHILCCYLLGIGVNFKTTIAHVNHLPILFSLY